MATSLLSSILLGKTQFSWEGLSYWVQGAGKNYSVTQTDSHTLRFEVRPGDVWTQYDNSGINRSEISSLKQIANGTPIHVAYSMNIEKAGDPNVFWTVLGQFHQDEYAGVPRNSPPFSISISNGKMTAVIGYTGADGKDTNKVIFTDSAPVLTNHDYKFSIDLTFDPKGDGHLSLVRDGIKIAEYNGPLGYVSQNSVYWKEGIYRPASSETMAVSYSDLAITTGSAVSQPPKGPSNPNVVNQYGPDGKIVSTTVDNPDGSVTVKKYGSAGDVVSATTKNIDGTTTTLLLKPDGSTTQKTVAAADGSKVVDNYAITGKSYVSEHATYDKSGAATSLTRTRADGQVELQQTFGKYAVTTFNQYDAAGSLLKKSVTQLDGSSEVYASNIKGQDYTLEQRSYDAAGKMLKMARFHDDGSLAYSQSTGPSGATTYMAYDATGHLVRKSVSMADGTREYTEYAPNDALHPTMQILYDTAGKIVKNTQFKADGSVVIYHDQIAGQSYTSDAITYDPSGKVKLIVRYHADKSLDYKQQVETDGSVRYEKYSPTGILTQKSVIALDGSKIVSDYGLKDKGYTSSEVAYNAKGTPTHMVQTWDDGSKRVSDYGITGKTYATENVSFNAKGAITSITRYHADGTADYVHTINPDGSGYEGVYDALGKQTLAINTKVDGSQTIKAMADGVTMISGKGADILNGFGNNDKFVFHGSFGKDTVNGFEASGHDIIQFDKAMVADFQHLQMAQQGKDVVITVNAHDSVVLKGAALAALTDHDFLFV